ncbi:MAG TPA: cell envelope biogenesis protein OmpA [Myxococcales bacterium]|nr:cell envelope biogenesis protein OmpA [Myxococcales bacterium]
MNFGRISDAAITALLTLSLLLLSACGPTYPKCNNDDHCRDKGEYCLENTCAQCRESTHCPNAANDACVTCDKGQCGRKPNCCTNKLDCGSGQKCTNNQCGPECASDADCTDGKTCNASGACVGAGKSCVNDSDCSPGQSCKSGKCTGGDGACQLGSIRFAFNQAKLTQEAQDVISANSACIRERKVVSVTIEGHCDERGTDAYNLELGNRRAQAVRRFLKNLGSGLKIRTVSYGKTRPLCTGPDESCWERNRRAEFVAR